MWGGHSNWVTCMDFYDPGNKERYEPPLRRILIYMFFVVDIKRSRLLTVTIDGRLDIWDFDATKHIIYKDQSVPNRPLILNNTTSFDSAFNLVENKDMPGICMTLTSQNMMVQKKRYVCSMEVY